MAAGPDRRSGGAASLLDVRGLEVDIPVPGGTLCTVRGVSLRAERLSFAGEDLRRAPPRRLRALRGDRIATVFQDPCSSLNPRRTAADVVGLPLAVPGVGTAAERRDAVAEMLGLVGLAPRHAAAYPFATPGRPAAARGSRQGARAAPRPGGLRRADLGARRLRAVADPEPL